MRSLLFALSLLLVPAAWADDGTLDLAVVYNGAGHYTFEKKDYASYGDLLAAIRAKYGTQHITTIDVDVTAGRTVAEMLEVCQLKHDTGAQIRAHYTLDKQKNDLFCS